MEAHIYYNKKTEEELFEIILLDTISAAKASIGNNKVNEIIYKSQNQKDGSKCGGRLSRIQDIVDNLRNRI